MPLYTYVAHYKGRTCVEQARRSNYRGFASQALNRMFVRGLLGVPSGLRNEMTHKTDRAAWAAVADTSNVWRTSFDLDGDQLELYAVQSKD